MATVGLFQVGQEMDPNRLLTEVSAFECKRYHELRKCPKRARQYLISRWLLRTHVSNEIGVPPSHVPIRENVDGPPTLTDRPGYKLGLSHSGDVCLCIASSGTRVGCDVEHHHSRRSVHGIARQFFHPREATSLSGLPEDEARQSFYRLWTLKEATQKALGRGIAGGLESPAFTLAPSLNCLAAPTCAPWTFFTAQVEHANARYALALAIADTATPAGPKVYEYDVSENDIQRRCLELSWQICSWKANSSNKTTARKRPDR